MFCLFDLTKVLKEWFGDQVVFTYFKEMAFNAESRNEYTDDSNRDPPHLLQVKKVEFYFSWSLFSGGNVHCLCSQ